MAKAIFLLVAVWLSFSNAAKMKRIQVRTNRESSSGHREKRYSPEESKSAAANATDVKLAFRLSHNDEFLEERDRVTTVYGTQKIRLEQVHRFGSERLRVWGGGGSAEVDSAGKLSGLTTGAALHGIGDDVVTADIPLKALHAIEVLQTYLDYDTSIFSFESYKHEKIICLHEDGKAGVCWLVNYLAVSSDDQTADIRPYGLIDATSGAVIASWNGITCLNIQAVGGNKKFDQEPKLHNINVYQDTAHPQGICYYKNSKVEVMDMKGHTPYSAEEFMVRGFPCDAASDATGFDNTREAFSPLNDIYAFADLTHDVFMETAGRSPLGTDSTSQIIRVKAHARACLDNAYWEGEFVIIGDGCSRFYPLTAVDVIAHEIAHGFTEHTSGLVYQGQSGGLNEAFSDMAGETVEYYYKQMFGETNDWKIGNDITKNHLPLRFLNNPTKDGVSIDHVNSYTTSYDVHLSSGIYNKAFYILSTQSGPSWDIKKAFKVFVLANRIEWGELTDFHCAACGCMNAAEALGFSVSDVVSALAAVGAQCTRCR